MNAGLISNLIIAIFVIVNKMESICIVNISGRGDSPNLCQLASGDNIVSFYGRGHDSS